MGYTTKVLGASGFSGGEVVRLLAGHPQMEAAALAGGERAGSSLAGVNPAFAGWDEVLLPLDEALKVGTDICFSCLPPAALEARLAESGSRVFVDLSDAHRADDAWTYGLTEYARPSIEQATLIANPGCYPTATLLGILPFARAELVTGPIVVDAVSGVSGAGRSVQDHLLHAVVDGGISAYGNGRHRHIPEMERSLRRFGGLDSVVSFTPHLAPMTRGLVATVRAPVTTTLTDEDALDILHQAYDDEAFVIPVDGWPNTKAVSGSNRALVTAKVDVAAGLLVVCCVIDNLGKGAAGAAIQNANVALGLEETTGLTGLGVWP